MAWSPCERLYETGGVCGKPAARLAGFADTSGSFADMSGDFADMSGNVPAGKVPGGMGMERRCQAA
ncbi:MAG: hypothetical protein LBF83_00240 [Spirochaetaceae bacterium]|nr:hypothetical protein [Spirochaetaceae bacterium]